MHADHVGWNTRLVDDRWVPTFPNAKYLFSPLELDSLQKDSRNPFDQYLRLVYEDSVLPIIQSGQAEMIDESTDNRYMRAVGKKGLEKATTWNG